VKSIKEGLTKTKFANLRFKKWFSTRHSMSIGSFLNLDTSLQKGVFEEFFTNYNLGIFVRSHGYDVFALNNYYLTDDDKSFADFCQKVFNDKIISEDGDYYWERNWEEKPPSYCRSEAAKYKYFTIKSIVKTMRFINVIKNTDEF
jgi:hypothetical protein